MAKGQITIYIILGLVVLIFGGALIYKLMSPDLIVERTDTSSPCLKKLAIDGLTKLSMQGSLDPEAYIASKSLKIAYFYYKDRSLIPSIDIIEQEVSFYITDHLDECNIQGDAHLVFEKEHANIILRMPDSRNQTAKVNVDFLSVFTVVQNIVSQVEKTPEWVDFETVHGTPFDVMILKVDKTTMIYEITDAELGLEGRPFKYRFAVKLI
ncbi:MAG: hypothetical protein HGA85_05740 [Nanoarchaeota archaeon]|nr:hypothetical protein [Nanoarchaeota archaeon]